MDSRIYFKGNLVIVKIFLILLSFQTSIGFIVIGHQKHEITRSSDDAFAWLLAGYS
jgi:hypothetical protein